MKPAINSHALALASLIAAASAPALAQSTGWYGGLNLGQSRATIDDKRITSSLMGSGFTVTGISDDNRDSGGKLFAGYQMNRNFALEGGYFDLGKFGFAATTLPAGVLNGTIKLRGFNLDLVGRLPVTERLDVFARVGANRAEARDSFTGSGAVFVRNPNPHKRDTQPKAGLGAEYAFNEAFSVRVEAERYRINDAVGNKGDIDLVSVGLVYRFNQHRRMPAAYTSAEPVRAVVAAAPSPPAEPAVVIPPASPVAPTPPAPVVPAQPRFERITLSATELFGFDSARLRMPQPKLDEIARALVANRDIANVAITGYTDRIGSREYNQNLSERRAKAVTNYLISQSVEARQLNATGKGEDNPVVTCTNDTRPALIECLAPNRRVEVEQITISRRAP
ncbi:MAG TPA: outer membrane beta-barrel protein [Usitatibacteraceae bacterium]|nr:outer membrane beta-barrel protein [Usitatibacteraceae bacterium]